MDISSDLQLKYKKEVLSDKGRLSRRCIISSL